MAGSVTFGVQKHHYVLAIRQRTCPYRDRKRLIFTDIFSFLGGRDTQGVLVDRDEIAVEKNVQDITRWMFAICAFGVGQIVPEDEWVLADAPHGEVSDVFGFGLSAIAYFEGVGVVPKSRSYVRGAVIGTIQKFSDSRAEPITDIISTSTHVGDLAAQICGHTATGYAFDVVNNTAASGLESLVHF